MDKEPGRKQQSAGAPLGRIFSGAAAGLARLRAQGFRQWLGAEREAFAQTVKVTLACVFGWWLATFALKVPLPVLVPIGVLLTVSATAYSTVVRGFQQVGAVVVGVAAATGLIWLMGVNALTLGVLVAAGLVLTRLLNLPAQNVQIPITALLVLSLGRTYGFARLADVLLGAAIGIAANLLILPPRFVEHAARELCDMSAELADLAQDMADGLSGHWTEDMARDWLDRSRELSQRLEETKDTADQAAESLRLTFRRRRRYDRRLRQSAEAATCLDHAGHQLRSIARGLVDLVAGARGLPGEKAADLPEPLAGELRALSRIFRDFGLIQVGKAASRDMANLCAALREGEHQQRHLAAELAGSPPKGPLWPLYGALLDDCARIRHEFDPDTGPHRSAFP
ncbi:aromatic acid exporter family protein [Nonomuraea sp. NPDC001636]|uniref:FUSC family protein n=1 Tax=Nonomuraea sp. NPDC001636 TaxID=3154391 RepID=UPI00333329FA